MIKILIVDDLDTKITSIKNILTKKCSIQETNIFVSKSVNSGLESLKSNFFDLVILDLVLPQLDGGTPTAEGGIAFINALNTGGLFQLPLQIICLTERLKELENKRPQLRELMISVIEKKVGDSTWESQLAEKVNYSKNLHLHVETVHKKRKKFDVGIICAVEVEFNQMLTVFGTKWSDYSYDDNKYVFKHITLRTKNNKIIEVIAASPHISGGTETSVLCSYMYSNFDIGYMFMTGITAGIKNDKIHLGDIIFSESALFYASGKIVQTEEGDEIKLNNENRHFNANNFLLQKMSDFILKNPNPMKDVKTRINNLLLRKELKVEDADDYNIYKFPTAAGPFVVASEKFVQQINFMQKDRKIRAFDMEGYDFYYAAHIYNKPALWIKSVVDMGDGDKDDKYQITASYSSALLLNLFIKEKLFFDESN